MNCWIWTAVLGTGCAIVACLTATSQAAEPRGYTPRPSGLAKGEYVYVSPVKGPKPYPEGLPWKWSDLEPKSIESADRKQEAWLMGTEGARHPVVLFDPDEIPAIRERLGRRMGPNIMAHLRRSAESGEPSAAGMYATLTGEKGVVKKGIANLISVARTEPAERRLPHGSQLYNLALGYDLLYNYMTPAQRQEVRTALDRSAQKMHLSDTVHTQGNWLPHCWGALGVAAYALQQENRYAESWLLRARFKNLQYMHNTFDPEGGDYEAFCRYFGMGMGKVLIMCAAERRQGRDFLTYRGNIFNRIVEFAAYMLVPYKHQSARPIDWRFMWVPYDDSFPVSTDPVSVWAAIGGLTKDPLAQWLFEATAPDTPQPHVSDPVTAAAFYDPDVPTESPDTSKRMSLARAYWGLKGKQIGLWSSGHVFLRTGFEDKETVVFSAQCGDDGEWHGHADQSGFFLYAYGDRLVMDPAIIGTYNEPLCEWMKGPESHSIVLVSGKGTPETSARRRRKKTWPRHLKRNRGAEVDRFVHTDTLDFVSMELRSTIEVDRRGTKARRAKRYVAFFRLPDRRAYLVMVDDVILDEGAHRYEWLLQPDDKHKIVKEGSGRFAFDGVPTRGAGFEFSGNVDLKIRMIEPRDPAHEIAANPMNDPRYVRYLRLRSKEDRTRGLFLTVLYPVKKEGMTLPSIEEIREGDVIGAKIGEDIVLFNTAGSGDAVASDVEFTGELAALRIVDGSVKDAVVLNGDSLTYKGSSVKFEAAGPRK